MNVPRLRFKDVNGREFPEWEEKKLGDVVDNYGGTALEEFVTEKGTHNFISIGNYEKDGRYFDNGQRIALNEKTKLRLLNAGELVMVLNDKTSSGDLIGSTLLIPEDNKYIYNQRSERLVCKTEIIDSKYAWHLLNSPKFRKLIYSISQGGTQIYVNFPSVKKLNAPIPSLPEQTKIANFLTAIDEKISQLTQKYDLLSQYKKGVMQQIFSQKLRFKDEDGREFPEWEVKLLGEISKFLDGRRRPIKESDRSKMKGQYPYYGASGIIDYVNDYIFDENIILLGEDGENILSRNLPLAFKVSGKCWINNHAHVIKPNLSTNIDFLTQYLDNISYVKYNTGTAQPKLNQEVCRAIPLNLPSLPEQTKIANFLTAIDNKITHTKTQLEAVKLYKKGLLQQLFV